MTVFSLISSVLGRVRYGRTGIASRTPDLACERVGGYPEPARLPPLLDGGEYRRRFVATSRLPAGLAAWLFDRAGFVPFLHRLEDDHERFDALLRTEDIRWSPFALPTLNACTVIADDPACGEPVARAARLVAAARAFHRDLHRGALEPDSFKGGPLEMGQYANLFGTCLCPGGTCSRVFKAEDRGYITVMVRGRCFRVDLPEPDGEVDVAALERGLRRAVELADRPAAPGRGAVGWLTVADLPRRSALVAATRLVPGNGALLDVIAGSFLVLCLDLDAGPGTLAETARQVHVGDPGNRWYFASWQIVVCGNGRAGFVYGYPCGLDGNVMMRSSEELARRGAATASGQERGDAAPVRPLELRLPRMAAVLARRWLSRNLEDRPVTFELMGLGNRRLKAAGLKPDAAFNLALIATLRRALGSCPTVLEHVTLARYRGMGLSMALVTTPRAVALAERMASDPADGEEVFGLLESAQTAHFAALSAAREALPLRVLTMLNLRDADPAMRSVAWLVAVATAGRPDVIVSQPGKRPGVLCLGRPGTRLSYVKHLGLHYQIHEESIILIFMPATDANLHPESLAASLEHDIRRIVDVAERGQTGKK